MTTDSDPLSQQHQTGSDFHYEYETNYGNNEWTTSSSSQPFAAYPVGSDSFIQQGHHQQHGPMMTESVDSGLPANYCFAACVFSSSSSATTTPPASVEPDNSLILSGSANVGAVSYSPAGHHHFIESSYDYLPASLLADESMLLVPHQ